MQKGPLTQGLDYIMRITSLRTALKLEASATRERCGLTREQLAETVGVSVSVLKRKLNPEDDPALHADEVAAICQRTGDYRLLDLVEQACGRIAVELPQGEGKGTVSDRLLGIRKAEGILAGELERPLVEATLPEVRRALGDVIRQWVGLEAELTRQVKGQDRG
jgi:hypothetical protein